MRCATAGVDGIHCVSRTCDLCGDACDANTQELNVLSCTFAKCEDLCYHQDCLEKVSLPRPIKFSSCLVVSTSSATHAWASDLQYLKSIRLERNRKTGFKCPRGCGKSSAYKDPCPGKIDKSHPIHPRNEEQKKKKKVRRQLLCCATTACKSCDLRLTCSGSALHMDNRWFYEPSPWQQLQQLLLGLHRSQQHGLQQQATLATACTIMYI